MRGSLRLLKFQLMISSKDNREILGFSLHLNAGPLCTRVAGEDGRISEGL